MAGLNGVIENLIQYCPCPYERAGDADEDGENVNRNRIWLSDEERHVNRVDHRTDHHSRNR